MLLVYILDCFAEYVIYIFNWNISIEIFVRAIQSFCRLSTSPSVQVIIDTAEQKSLAEVCEGIISSPNILQLHMQGYLVVGDI